ncbi:MAG: (4Fe-4S)-binding protein [Acidobacteriota bacterium]
MTRVNARTIKTIRIDIAKCNGCRACEVICAAFHAKPQYSSTNPARSRVRVIRDPVADIYLPVFAGEYTAAECAGRDRYVIDGRVYDECAFCRASCPSRDVFKEPDSDLPLKCDMCESDPDIAEPVCVQWCLAHALVYEERDVTVEKAAALDDVDIGLQALADVHGWPRVREALGRMAARGARSR